MKRILQYGLFICLFVLYGGQINFVMAIDINSSSDWSSVGPNDYVTIKMTGTVTLPSDITCKQISFEQNNTTLDLGEHTLTVTENLYMTNRSGLNISNGGTINVGENFEMKSQNGTVKADVNVTGSLYMSDQSNMSITGNVTVGKDFQMKSQNGKVTGNVSVGEYMYMIDQTGMKIDGNLTAGKGFQMKSQNATVTGDVTVTNGDLYVIDQTNMSIEGSVSVSGNFQLKSQNARIGGVGESITVGGSLYVIDQTGMSLSGDVSVEQDIEMKTQNGSISGNVSVGGSLYMRDQSGMRIDGDVSVGGNLEMTGQNNSISGTAAIAGTYNISNGSTITGGTTEYVAPVHGSVSITDNQCSTNSFIAVPEDYTPTSYQWYMENGMPISGATSATYNPSSLGKYYVVASDGSSNVTSDLVEYYGGVAMITSVSPLSLSFANSLNGSGKSHKTIKLNTICDVTVDYSLSGEGRDKFSVSKTDENTYEVTFNETETQGTYGAVLKFKNHVAPETNYFEIPLSGTVTSFPACYNVQIKVDGNYYKTHSLCTDNDGNISIDLSDGDGFWWIPTSECSSNNTVQVYSPSKQEWRTVCKNVTIELINDIVCNDFTFINNINNGAPISFVFKNTVTCNKMNLTVNNTQQIDYVVFDCSSIIYASTSFRYDHDCRPISIKGTIISPDVYLSDGNNTSIQIDDCAYINTDVLTLAQSSQNNVVINGHVVAETIKSDANIVLSYNGDITNPAVITVGSVASNILVVCGEYTTVNLCLNPSMGTSDKLGYFLGDVLYNYSAVNGWSSVQPTTEGDINYSSFFGFDDTWRNSHWRSDWGISAEGLSKVNQIRAYSSYANCMHELTDAMILGMDDDPFMPDDKEIKMLYEDFNPCSEEYKDTKIQLRELGGRWFRYINGELIYCEGDNQ